MIQEQEMVWIYFYQAYEFPETAKGKIALYTDKGSLTKLAKLLCAFSLDLELWTLFSVLIVSDLGKNQNSDKPI